jgi:hypothetical protein
VDRFDAVPAPITLLLLIKCILHFDAAPVHSPVPTTSQRCEEERLKWLLRRSPD